MKADKKIKVKQLVTYLAKRKSPWLVAVYDKKSKKRAVGQSLAEVLKKMDVDAEDLIVINYREWVEENEDGHKKA